VFAVENLSANDQSHGTPRRKPHFAFPDGSHSWLGRFSGRSSKSIDRGRVVRERHIQQSCISSTFNSLFPCVSAAGDVRLHHDLGEAGRHDMRGVTVALNTQKAPPNSAGRGKI
jgi:hypothetical protein